MIISIVSNKVGDQNEHVAFSLSSFSDEWAESSVALLSP